MGLLNLPEIKNCISKANIREIVFGKRIDIFLAFDIVPYTAFSTMKASQK